MGFGGIGFVLGEMFFPASWSKPELSRVYGGIFLFGILLPALLAAAWGWGWLQRPLSDGRRPNYAHLDRMFAVGFFLLMFLLIAYANR